MIIPFFSRASNIRYVLKVASNHYNITKYHMFPIFGKAARIESHIPIC